MTRNHTPQTVRDRTAVAELLLTRDTRYTNLSAPNDRRGACFVESYFRPKCNCLFVCVLVCVCFFRVES